MINPQQREALDAGLHQNIPAATYHRLPYASNSRLSVLAKRSPKHLAHAMDCPADPTPEMVIGEAVHVAVLQTELFNDAFAKCPNVDRRTKEGKAVYAAFCEKHGGKVILHGDDWDRVVGIARAVAADTNASNVLAGCHQREVSAVWEDKSGLVCKARFDGFGASERMILDLKTTPDASPDAFERTIFNYGYHRQAAMYVNGAAALGHTVDDYIILALEKEPPYAVGFYRLTDEAIEMGAAELRPLIEMYRHCELINQWPGYQPRDIGIPAWAAKRIGNTL